MQAQFIPRRIQDQQDVNATSLGTGFPLVWVGDHFETQQVNFSDLAGTIALEQFPPGSVVTIDSIGEDALYFFDESTGLPSLISADQVAAFLNGRIAFSNLSGVIDISQFPAGTVATLDSIDEDAFYFFDNVLFAPKLLGHDDAIDFLLPNQTSNDGKFLKTNAGILSWAAVSSGGVWGSITGTLSSQTDLQAALDAKQPLDADLTTIAGLTATTDNFIVSVSSAWASRTPAQVRTTLGLVIGTNVQAWDADLDTLAGLTATTDNFIVSASSAWASRTPAQVRTTLGLVIGTNVQAWDADLDALAALSGTNNIYYRSAANTWSSVTIGSGLTFSSGTLSSSGTADNLGLTPTAVKTSNYSAAAGDFVPVDTTSGNVTITFPTAPADKSVLAIKHVIQGGSNTVSLALGGSDVFNKTGGATSGSLTLVNQAILLQYKSSGAIWYVISDDLSLSALDGRYQPLDSDLTTIAGLTATTDNFIVSVSSAWASRTPTQVKTTLGLTIGTNVQAWDADLDTIAGLTATTDNFIVSVSSAWASRTPSQVRTTLGLVIGTNVQAWDADLDTWAGITPASNVGTFLATPSSANLRSAMTDESGTGANLFDGCTLTLLLTTAACGSSLASINIPAGTVPTTPNDGDIFADANCFYGCTDAGNPGVFSVYHIIRADSTVTQANDANAHAIFTTPTNGRLTLETGTYRFQGILNWSSMSATSGNVKLDILGAGTATTGAWLWWSIGQDSVIATAAGLGGQWNTTSATNTNAISTSTATVAFIDIRGTFEVTGAGTIIPTQTLQSAAAAVLAIGSFIEFWRVGSTSMTSVGQWD